MGSLLVREIAIPHRADRTPLEMLADTLRFPDALELLTYLASIGLLVARRPLAASGCLVFGLSLVPSLQRELTWRQDHVAGMRSLQLRAAKAIPNHTHGLNAADRALANEYISRLVSDPKRRYVLQMAARDSACSGAHTVVTSRDTGVAPRMDPLDPDHTLVLVDTDYYVDMNQVLRLGVPILLYTFCPVLPAGNHDGMTWCVKSPEEMSARVAGGSPFTHALWDYDRDYVSVLHGRRLMEFKVEARRVSTTHTLVLLQPRKSTISWMPGLLGLPLPFSPYRIAPLTRRVLAREGTNAAGNKTTAANWMHSDGSVSVAPLGLPHCVTLRVSTVAALTTALRNKAFSHLGVVSLLRDEPCGKLPTAVQLVQDCFLTDAIMQTSFWKPMTEAEAKVNYTVESHDPQDPPRPAGAALPVPEVAGVAVFPAVSAAMAADSVARRITDVNRPVTFSAEVRAYLSQFIARLDQYNHVKLLPLSVEEVDKRLSKPAQRARTEAAALEINRVSAYPFEQLEVKAFQKREAYTSAKPARNISTVPQTHLIELARYTYPVYDHLKNYNWFGCGRTPLDTARLVTNVANCMKPVYETDFSKFDGTITKDWHAFVADVFVMLYQDPHPKRVLFRELAPRARSQAGAYDTQGSRLSGSPVTTIGNTLINAAVSFIAQSMYAEAECKGHSEFIMERLGLFAGDDGLIPGFAPVKYFEAAAAATGLQLKLVVRPPTTPCSFLGRFYLSPADRACSMADLPRQLPKLVVTADRQNPPLIALYHKALSWVITDYYTPIIGYWASAVVRIIEDANPRLRVRPELLRYDARHRTDDPNLEPTYGQCLPLILHWYPGLTEADIKDFEKACRHARSLEELPTLVNRGPTVEGPYRLVGDASLPATEHKECSQSRSELASSTRSRPRASHPTPAASQTTSSSRAEQPRSGPGGRSRPPVTALTCSQSATTSSPTGSPPSSSGTTTSSGTRTRRPSDTPPFSSTSPTTMPAPPSSSTSSSVPSHGPGLWVLPATRLPARSRIATPSTALTAEEQAAEERIMRLEYAANVPYPPASPVSDACDGVNDPPGALPGAQLDNEPCDP